jgi:hypothetical protein
VAGFLAGGHAALGQVADRQRPRTPARAFAEILQNVGFLNQQMPGTVERLLACPAAAVREGNAFGYWAKERFGGKTVVTATLVALFLDDRASRPAGMTIGIQMFATHYLDASLGVTAVVRDDASSRTYFVYMNRSEVDVLGGFWGGLARSLIEARIRKDGPAILREVRERLRNGRP